MKDIECKKVNEGQFGGWMKAGDWGQNSRNGQNSNHSGNSHETPTGQANHQSNSSGVAQRMQPVATQQLFEEEASRTDGGEPMSRLCVFSPQEQRERQGSKANLSQKKDALIVHKLLEQHQMGQGMEMEEQRQVAVIGVEKTSEVEFSTEAMDVREEVQLRNNRTWRRATRQRTTPLKSIEEEGEDHKGKTKKRGRKAGVLKQSNKTDPMNEGGKGRNLKLQQMRKLGMEDRWKLVEPVGISGGLLLMWNLEVEIKQVKCSEFSIGVEFRMEGEAMWEWCTFVNMNTDKRVRTMQWNQLTEEKNGWGRKWLLVGDWNDICWQEEKKGGRLRSEANMLGFRGFVDRMGMKKLDMIGQSYTWGNNREGEGFVEERIDKAFASFDWLNQVCSSAKITAPSSCVVPSLPFQVSFGSSSWIWPSPSGIFLSIMAHGSSHYLAKNQAGPLGSKLVQVADKSGQASQQDTSMEHCEVEPYFKEKGDVLSPPLTSNLTKHVPHSICMSWTSQSQQPSSSSRGQEWIAWSKCTSMRDSQIQHSKPPNRSRQVKGTLVLSFVKWLSKLRKRVFLCPLPLTSTRPDLFPPPFGRLGQLKVNNKPKESRASDRYLTSSTCVSPDIFSYQGLAAEGLNIPLVPADRVVHTSGRGPRVDGPKIKKRKEKKD
ncbi:retrotransposon protein [Striga asiatica]|uniref:Retrotransposon protein n=1 Tax=Striga asiatica TaxID=4170 RepID=A0A5A7PXH4_STRAF|nr:retrotransposon protein [Striga asiatica]